MRRPTCPLLALIVALAASAGCGDSTPYGKVKVTGKVLYTDGTPVPVEQIAIRFDSLEPPIDEKTHPRPGLAYTDEEGNFDKVTTSKYGDGIVQGRHKVQISAVDQKGKLLVAEKYNKFETTPIEVNSSDAPFEFLVDRP